MSENEQNNTGQEEAKARTSINDMARQMTKGSKGLGIVVAIIMIVLGILFMVRPLITEAIAMILATVGFIIYGIYQIVVYVRTPAELRNGWSIANGIIFIVLGIIIIASGPLDMYMTFAFLLAFLAIFGGMNQIMAFAALNKAKAPGAGWMLASGIINLVIGVFFLITPFAAGFALAYVLGIYLIVGGIALLAETLSGSSGMRPQA